MRSLLVEAAQTAPRVKPDLRRHYQRLQFRGETAIATVAIARKLAARLYWMLRTQVDCTELVRWKSIVARPQAEPEEQIGIAEGGLRLHSKKAANVRLNEPLSRPSATEQHSARAVTSQPGWA